VPLQERALRHSRVFNLGLFDTQSPILHEIANDAVPVSAIFIIALMHALLEMSKGLNQTVHMIYI
jgi:hypothetical protein